MIKIRKREKIILVSLIIISIISWTGLITELEQKCFIGESNIPESILNSLKTQLWDSTYESYYSYRFVNGTLSERSMQKYTSFNIWGVRALLHYSLMKNDFSIFEDYGFKTLQFLSYYLRNETNKGFYHWTYQNGSLPESGTIYHNNSIAQIGTYQAWVLLTLIDIYSFTGNTSYLTAWGNETANFLIQKFWDPIYKGFYSEYLPIYDINPDPLKHTWYQAWPALALMAYYEITRNETYLLYANATIDFMINNLWDDQIKAFNRRAFENGTIDPLCGFTLTDQAATLLLLTKAAEITGNMGYWNNYIVPILNFTQQFLWDNENGQFYSECDSNGANAVPRNRPSDLSIWLFTLYKVIKSLNDSILERQLGSAITQLISVGWDTNSNAFVREFWNNGTIINSDKWTIEQALPLLLFSYYIWEHSLNVEAICIKTFVYIGTVIVLFYFWKKKPKSLSNEKEKKSTISRRPLKLQK